MEYINHTYNQLRKNPFTLYKPTICWRGGGGGLHNIKKLFIIGWE